MAVPPVAYLASRPRADDAARPVLRKSRVERWRGPGSQSEWAPRCLPPHSRAGSARVRRVSWLSTFLTEALEGWSDLARFGWGAFPARNMRLETRLDAGRQAEYLAAVDKPHSRNAWLEQHRSYHLESVRCPTVPARTMLRKASRSSWPSPFRSLAARNSPLDIAGDVSLVHVASLRSIASATRGIDAADIVDAVEDGDEGFLDPVLDAWWRRSASRSTFAALAADVRPALRAAENGDPDWADALRNLLGLVHHNPLVNPISVMLFRYRVAEVPRVEGLRDKRPLVAPTALDSGLGEAFYPGPRADLPGRAVDLGARIDDPVREVLHPCPQFGARHVVAVGEIATAVPDLVQARWAHRELVRALVGPADFGAGVDDDLDA